MLLSKNSTQLKLNRGKVLFKHSIGHARGQIGKLTLKVQSTSQSLHEHNYLPTRLLPSDFPLYKPGIIFVDIEDKPALGSAATTTVLGFLCRRQVMIACKSQRSLTFTSIHIAIFYGNWPTTIANQISNYFCAFRSCLRIL